MLTERWSTFCSVSLFYCLTMYSRKSLISFSVQPLLRRNSIILLMALSLNDSIPYPFCLSRFFGISTPEAVSPSRCLLRNSKRLQPRSVLYGEVPTASFTATDRQRTTPGNTPERNSQISQSQKIKKERCARTSVPTTLACCLRKIKGTLRAVEIYKKSFSPCVRKSFFINTTVCPFIFRRECGTALGKRGSRQHFGTVGGASPRRCTPRPVKKKHTLPKGKEESTESLPEGR